MNVYYLNNSIEIERRIAELFNSKSDKYAVVGFIGANPMDYLPSEISGLTVVCWPKPGATCADGIRSLLAAGVTVKFCANLHVKLYWAKGVGLVTGSANLSESALSEQGLKEFAVFIEDTQFDIQSILSQIGQLTNVTQDVMDKLDAADRLRGGFTKQSSRKKAPTFAEYCQSVYKKRWKIVSYSDDWSKTQEQSIKRQTKDEYGDSNRENSNEVDEINSFEQGDIVLQVKTDSDGLYSDKRYPVKWLRVDFKSISPNAIIQRTSISQIDINVPFVIDTNFKVALQKLFELEWSEIIDKKSFVLDSAIKLLLDEYCQTMD